MAASKFNRLIRFRTSAGKIHYGEAGDLESALDTLHGQTVRVYEGQNPWDSDFNLTSDREKIAEVSRSAIEKIATAALTGCLPQVLSPISMTPIGYGIGVNYGAHSKESNVRSNYANHVVFSTFAMIRAEIWCYSCHPYLIRLHSQRRQVSRPEVLFMCERHRILTTHGSIWLDTLAGPFEDVLFTTELAELDYEVQSISIDSCLRLRPI